MIQLPHGARCSELSVFPKNWNTKDANLNTTWYIKYRFYPAEAEAEQIVIKGFAKYGLLAERRKAITDYLKGIKEDLLAGYDPRKGKKCFPDEKEESGKFLTCLQEAYEFKQCGYKHKAEIRHALPWIKKAVMRLGFNMPANAITRKHIRLILEEIGKIKPVWTDNQFNVKRKVLYSLFEEMIELEMADNNPALQIRKRESVKKKRRKLTDDECDIVDQHLSAKYPEFRRFMFMFFFTGGRVSELMRVRKADVNLSDQTFKCIILKGKKGKKEVEKPIHNTVLPYWQELMNMKGEFLFSKGLKPGKEPINPAQISRRWKKHVKEKLGIEADFYSLKHRYLDKLSVATSLVIASKAAHHTSTKTTKEFYTDDDVREFERMKSVNVKFG